MTYTRIYADEHGESHIEEVAVELTARDFAPPAPPLYLSSMTPATGVAFVRVPPGWVGDWHPTPRRQYFFFMRGELEGEASDGSRQRYSPGDVVLLEDTTGRGHRSWVIGDDDVLAAVVQVAD